MDHVPKYNVHAVDPHNKVIKPTKQSFNTMRGAETFINSHSGRLDGKRIIHWFMNGKIFK